MPSHQKHLELSIEDSVPPHKYIGVYTGIWGVPKNFGAFKTILKTLRDLGALLKISGVSSRDFEVSQGYFGPAK